MLVGLAAKNAILIVEFARSLAERGMAWADAAMEAAKIRMRPILMTSFAFTFGVLPMAAALTRMLAAQLRDELVLVLEVAVRAVARQGGDEHLV